MPDATPAALQLGFEQPRFDEPIDLSCDRRLRTAGPLDKLRNREASFGFQIGRAEEPAAAYRCGRSARAAVAQYSHSASFHALCE